MVQYTVGWPLDEKPDGRPASGPKSPSKDPLSVAGLGARIRLERPSWHASQVVGGLRSGRSLVNPIPHYIYRAGLAVVLHIYYHRLYFR